MAIDIPYRRSRSRTSVPSHVYICFPFMFSHHFAAVNASLYIISEVTCDKLAANSLKNVSLTVDQCLDA